MKLSNTDYDKFKKILLTIVPAFAALLLSLGEVFNWNWATVISGTLSAFATFFGEMLLSSSRDYWKEADDVGNDVVGEDLNNEVEEE